MIVRTPYDDAIALDRQLVRRLAGWAGVALLLGAGVLVAIVWTAKLRNRRLLMQ